MCNHHRFLRSVCFVIGMLLPVSMSVVFAAGEYTEPGYIDRVLYPEGYSILSSDHVMFPVDVRDWPIKIDARRQLFVDDYLVAEMTGLTRQYHAMVKHPANPVIRADRPWEGTAVGPRHVAYDEATGRFRMWYSSSVPYKEGDKMLRRAATLYAESDDGVHWTKPELGQVEVEGSKANNVILMPGAPRFIHRDESRPADERYVALISHKPPRDDVEREGMFLYTSPDGMHWTGHLDQFVIPHLETVSMPQDGIGDTTIFRYDPYLKRYICDCKFLIPDDRLGRLRVRGMAESEDLIHWTRPRVILYPDERDDPDAQIYAQMSFVYESMWLGSVRVMRVERVGWKQTEVEFSYSRDGRHWCRPAKRQPLLALGDPDGWEPDYSSMINQAPLVIGDELWFYYMGSRNPEREGRPIREPWDMAIGLAKLRRDGFASLDGGDEPGIVLTRPLTFAGKTLYVNADVADGGYVKVAVLSRKSEPIVGFGLEDAVAVTGDRTKLQVTWKDRSQLKPSSSVTDHYRLKFEIKNAKLYSFWIE